MLKNPSKIVRCTKCHEVFGDMRIEVIMDVNTERAKNDGSWENISNLNLTSREMLCPKCFYEFSDKMKELNVSMKSDIINPLEVFQNDDESLIEKPINDFVLPYCEPYTIQDEQIIYGTDIRGETRVFNSDMRSQTHTSTIISD